MSPAASDVASDLVNQIPSLVNTLRKYDEQNFELQLRYENLEEEIARVRRSIKHKQTQQVRFVEQLAVKDLGKGKLKRQRSEDQPDMRTQRPRLESFDDRLVQLLSSESELSLNSKRKGRVFQNLFEADKDGGDSSRAD